MEKYRNTLSVLWHDTRVRFLFFGGINTFAGYFISLFLYFLLKDSIHIILISIFASLISISLSFITQKFFVFCSQKPLLVEYLKNMVAYSFNIAMSSILVWLLVTQAKLSFWLAQAMIIPIMVIVSYFVQQRFTFK